MFRYLFLAFLGGIAFTGIYAAITHADTPIGWRTDGTGRYPKAKPPLEWSTEKNVVWKTPMPGQSNSQPVILGERIFICSEPCMLLCVDRDSGKILWQKNSSYDELEISTPDRDRLKIELKEVQELNKQLSTLSRERETLRRKLKDDPASKTEVEKYLDELMKKSDAVNAERQLRTLALRYTEPGKQGTAGYSTPTPVTDGEEVFVAFGNGLVACFDLDGNRKWLKLVEHSTAPYAHGNSPTLIGDKVFIHFADLVALNTKDGAECWRLKKSPPHGTSIAVKIGGVDMLVTPNGMVVRAEDGVVLAEGLGSSGANSPIVQDGVAYFVRNSPTAVKLPDSLSEPTKLTPLWKGKQKGGGYWYPSSVVHEGLLYSVDDRGIFTVLDATDGKLVYEERLELGGTHYPSISLAGNRVFVSTDKGITAIIACGREFKMLGQNELEPFRSSLVFQGERMYVRTHKHLFCIGR